MKKIMLFFFTIILILNGNGLATEIVPVNLDLFDNSSAVGEIHNAGAVTISKPGLEQTHHAVLEPVTTLILGLGLVSLGIFARKKFSRR